MTTTTTETSGLQEMECSLKPLEFKAMHFDGSPEDLRAAYEWAKDHTAGGEYDPHADGIPLTGVRADLYIGGMVLATPYGEQHVEVGDYLVYRNFSEDFPGEVPAVFAYSPENFHASFDIQSEA